MSLAAFGHIDAATGGGVASIEGNAGTIVVILEVRLDPAGGEGTGTLEGQGGGIEEVVDVQVSELHAHGLANTGSLVVGDGGVDYLEAVELPGAAAHNGVHADGSNATALGGTGNDDADGMGTGSQVDTAAGVVG